MSFSVVEGWESFGLTTGGKKYAGTCGLEPADTVGSSVSCVCSRSSEALSDESVATLVAGGNTFPLPLKRLMKVIPVGQRGVRSVARMENREIDQFLYYFTLLERLSEGDCKLVCRQIVRFTDRFLDQAERSMEERNGLLRQQESGLNSLVEVLSVASSVEGVLLKSTLHRHQEELEAMRAGLEEAERAMESQLRQHLLEYVMSLTKKAFCGLEPLSFPSMWQWSQYLLRRSTEGQGCSAPLLAYIIPFFGIPVASYALTKPPSDAPSSTFLHSHFPVVLNISSINDLAVCLGGAASPHRHDTEGRRDLSGLHLSPSSPADNPMTTEAFRIRVTQEHLCALSSEQHSVLLLIGSESMADRLLEAIHTPELLLPDRSIHDGWTTGVETRHLVPRTYRLQLQSGTNLWGAEVLFLYTPTAVQDEKEAEVRQVLGDVLDLVEEWGVSTLSVAHLSACLTALPGTVHSSPVSRVSPGKASVESNVCKTDMEIILRQLRQCFTRKREALRSPGYGSQLFTPLSFAEGKTGTPRSVSTSGLYLHLFLPVPSHSIRDDRPRGDAGHRLGKRHAGILQSLVGAPKGSTPTAVTAATAAAAARSAVETGNTEARRSSNTSSSTTTLSEYLTGLLGEPVTLR